MKALWRFSWLGLALAGVLLWLNFGLPRYRSIDLSVNQSKAVSIAAEFLRSAHGVDTAGYKTAALFFVDEDTDRYLQRTIGIPASQKLLGDLHYDLFGWVVRFFKEKQREEFKVTISSKTGQVIGLVHEIEDTAARPQVEKEQARHLALDFLKTHFGFDPSDHTLDREDSRKFDNRLDYAFVWRDNNVTIPWDSSKKHGSAKLLTTVVVSGTEILNFNKTQFDIPEGFDRYIDNLKQTGENLTTVFRLMYLGLLTAAIMMVVNRKNHLVPRLVSHFYIRVGAVLFILMCADTINGYQLFQYNYPTAQSLFDYIVRKCMDGLIAPFFVVIAFVLPAMAGESLRFNIFPHKKTAGFLSAVMSSFATRSMAGQIAVGYAFAAFLLGIQALIFVMGYRYCGVWDELSWLTQSSTSVFPALTALLIGLQASFSEEVMFRLFAVNLLKKYGFTTFMAVLAGAVMWGFGHTGYAIFPMWFRGIEVTCLGLVLGFAYLRFGLATAITAHFLMDSFLTVLPYLMKPAASVDFIGSMTVVCLPLLLGLAAFMLNRSTQERAMALDFNRHQEFNYGLLRDLCRGKNPAELAGLKQQLLRHGWDPAVVDRAFNEV